MGQSTSQSIHISQDLTALTELVHNNTTTTPTTTTTPERMCTLIPFPKSWAVLPKVQTLHLGLLSPQTMGRGERKKHNSIVISLETGSTYRLLQTQMENKLERKSLRQ